MKSNDSVVLGRTNNFKRRFGAYQTHNPSIQVVKLFTFNYASQVDECERSVLEALSNENIKPNHKREWFDVAHLERIIYYAKKWRGYILQREFFCEVK